MTDLTGFNKAILKQAIINILTEVEVLTSRIATLDAVVLTVWPEHADHEPYEKAVDQGVGCLTVGIMTLVRAFPDDVQGIKNKDDTLLSDYGLLQTDEDGTSVLDAVRAALASAEARKRLADETFEPKQTGEGGRVDPDAPITPEQQDEIVRTTAATDAD